MIKAEFFRDEKIGALSHMARLLFLSMLVHCDDSGVGRAATRILRSDAFPYDEHITSKQVESAFKETVGMALAEEFESSGEKYYRIPNFNKHQTINRPSAFRFVEDSEPSPENTEDSFNLHEHSLMKEKGKEKGKVKEKEKEVVSEPAVPSVSAEKCFEEARRAFRRIVGGNLGSLGQRKDEWAGFVTKHGADRAIAAVKLWARENKQWLKSECKYPLTNFLKNKEQMIEAVEIERERPPEPEGKSADGFIEDTTTPTVDDIRPPDYAPSKRTVQ